MQNKKYIELKLFHTPGIYYVQLGENLYPIKERVALLIAEKEGMEIRKCNTVKEVQILSNDDKK